MIRYLTPQDALPLKEVFFQSFSQDEAPVTYDLMMKIISQETHPTSLCLGYDVDGALQGAVGFTPVYFAKGVDVTAYILAPLAVHSAHQGQGIATELVTHAKQTLSEQGIDALLVYGDPNYYGRHGFTVDMGQKFVPPYPLEFDFGWQAMMLNSNKITDEAYQFTSVEALSDPALW